MMFYNIYLSNMIRSTKAIVSFCLTCFIMLLLITCFVSVLTVMGIVFRRNWDDWLNSTRKVPLEYRNSYPYMVPTPPQLSSIHKGVL